MRKIEHQTESGTRREAPLRYCVLPFSIGHLMSRQSPGRGLVVSQVTDGAYIYSVLRLWKYLCDIDNMSTSHRKAWVDRLPTPEIHPEKGT